MFSEDGLMTEYCTQPFCESWTTLFFFFELETDSGQVIWRHPVVKYLGFYWSWKKKQRLTKKVVDSETSGLEAKTNLEYNNAAYS